MNDERADGEQVIAEIMDQLKYATRRAGEFRSLAHVSAKRIAELEQENHALKKQLEEKKPSSKPKPD